MSDNIRVGLIGYGYASKTFHAPLIAGTPGLELAVISSSDETKVKADWPTVTVVSEPKHLFNDPNIDLIVIPTPNDTHFPLAKAALEAGKHVVVDKPFTVTLSQARELDALAKSLGRVLSVFHNRRWDSDFLTLKGLLAEGVLGEVAYFESHFDRFRPQVRDRWREQGGPGSGIWYDLAPHLLDQAITLFGLPVSMTVDLAQLRPGAQSTDYFHAILSYPQRRVILHGTMLAAAESARYIVHGSRGSYVKYGLDPQEERLKNGERLPQEDWGYDMRDGVLTRVEGEERVEETLLTVPGNYPAYYAAIRDALNGDGENPVPASQAIQAMELIELGIESAKHRATLCLANGGGVILTITSMAAENKNINMTSYASSKAAASHLVRNMAFDLGEKNIRVNGIAPGAILTDALKSVITPEIEQKMLQHTPIRRLGQPQDIANAALFLCSPAASWVSGQILTVSGGGVQELN
ncbi:oxidoreductase [Escherichia coli]|nr:oxidoreductase [Escherichia coli]